MPRDGSSKPSGKVAKGASADAATTDRLSFSGQALPAQPPDLSAYRNLHRLDLSKTTGLRDLNWLASVAGTLTWLSVSGSDITSLDGLDKLVNLLVLDISRCRLGKLPKGLKKLTRLTALIAKSCELSSLKHLPASLPLTSLIVSENPLTRLPDSVASLSQLEKLSAAKCGLTAAGLPDLSACTALREVRLAHNPLGGLPDHIGGWANGRLEILALGHCELPAILALDPLRRQSALSSLDVVGNAAFVVPATDPQHERYKSQMVALLHSLRILDGQRFDPAFIARKAKRAARPAPLDPAKPTTSANAEPVAERPAKKRRTADVEVEPVVEPERKKKSKKRDRQDAPLLALPKPPPEPEATEPPVPPDARDRTGAAPRERTSVVAVVDVARPAGSGKKSKRKADAGPVDDGAELAAFFGGGNAVAAADDEATGLSLGGW